MVLDRCAWAGGPLSGAQVPIDEAQAELAAANRRMGEQGLRVLAFAARILGDDDEATMREDPMALTRELGFIGMVGMIDPLRPEAKAAVTTALSAGIDVRMITGDNAITAGAIGAEPGPRPRGDQRRGVPGALRRADPRAVAEPARLRPRLARGQAAARPDHAGPGHGRRSDRRRRERRRGAQAGGHRRRDGQRQRGDQAGRADDPHRRQLRDARARRRARPARVRQGRRLRALPDDAADRARAAVPHRERLRHQRRASRSPR